MEDRRVRRTRTALRDALIALMAEKGYDAVTVQELIDRADIGRSTFYSHFTDKSDLLQDMLGELRAIVEPTAPARRPDPRRPLRFSLEMFRHVQDQQLLLRALLGRPGAGPVMAQIERLLTDVVRAELDELVRARTAPRVPLDLVAAAVVASFVAALVWWIDDDFGRTPEELDDYFQTLVVPGVRAAIPAAPASRRV